VRLVNQEEDCPKDEYLVEGQVSRQIFNLEKVDRFTLGTVGQPGERQFFIQARKMGQVFSFALEKGQAQALNDRFREILKESKLNKVQLERDISPLDTPIEAEFELGVMAISWKYDSDLITFEAQGVSNLQSDRVFEEIVGDDIDDAPPILRVSLTPIQVRSFVDRASSVIKAGRQPCMFCGAPINLDGHFCPRAN
jgi:uncharacterized repeat protein (TIGR03847 family)